jgi:hypothetical protein
MCVYSVLLGYVVYCRLLLYIQHHGSTQRVNRNVWFKIFVPSILCVIAIRLLSTKGTI